MTTAISWSLSRESLDQNDAVGRFSPQRVPRGLEAEPGAGPVARGTNRPGSQEEAQSAPPPPTLPFPAPTVFPENVLCARPCAHIVPLLCMHTPEESVTFSLWLRASEGSGRATRSGSRPFCPQPLTFLIPGSLLHSSIQSHLLAKCRPHSGVFGKSDPLLPGLIPHEPLDPCQNPLF